MRDIIRHILELALEEGDGQFFSFKKLLAMELPAWLAKDMVQMRDDVWPSGPVTYEPGPGCGLHARYELRPMEKPATRYSDETKLAFDHLVSVILFEDGRRQTAYEWLAKMVHADLHGELRGIYGTPPWEQKS